MSTAVAAAPSFDLANIDALVNQIEKASEGLSSDRLNYIKFSKGDWLIGKEQETFPENSFEAIPDLPNLENGYVCWKDGQLTDELWFGIGEDLPSKVSLPDHGPYTQQNDGWSQNVRFQMNILPTMGVESPIYAQFTASSGGGQRAVGDMMKAWVREMKTGKYDTKVPVFKFSSDSYKHSTYGKVYVPLMTLDRFIDPPVVQKPTEDKSSTGSSASKDIPLE